MIVYFKMTNNRIESNQYDDMVTDDDDNELYNDGIWNYFWSWSELLNGVHFGIQCDTFRVCVFVFNSKEKLTLFSADSLLLGQSLESIHFSHQQKQPSNMELLKGGSSFICSLLVLIFIYDYRIDV